MLFSTDKHTLNDLNIFGISGEVSIFSMYNFCVTKGGSALLSDMLRFPLSTHQAINQRCYSIQHLAKTAIEFPFLSADIDAAETYMANTDERSRLLHEKISIVKKLNQLISVEIETAIIYKGINAVVNIIKCFNHFVAAVHNGEADFSVADKKILADLLKLPGIETLIHIKGKSKLSHTEMIKYDSLFRFVNRDIIQKLLQSVYLLDVYLSVAKLSVERKFVFAQAKPSDKLELLLEDVYHPQVKNAIANSIHINQDNNLVFLTGANMAGKSTFMKSVAIALYVAHIGFPVPARRMQFSVMNGIYTTINLPDDLGVGASHFYAEVLRVKKIANELGQLKKLFVVFDELFRGTNVKDAYDATTAIVKAFAAKRNSIFIVSTHIIETGEALKECPNVSFKYLPTNMKGNTPQYTYMLKEGITADRHGMVIIKNEGIIEILNNGKRTSSVL